jgi:hypothetical protein
MAIIFYKENKEKEEVEYKPIKPIVPPEEKPKYPFITPNTPEKQRYMQLLKEYNELIHELMRCQGKIPPPYLTSLLGAEEIDYEEISEELSFEIRKLKQQLEECKRKKQEKIEQPKPQPPETLITEPPKAPKPELPKIPEPQKAGFPKWILYVGLGLLALNFLKNKMR